MPADEPFAHEEDPRLRLALDESWAAIGLQKDQLDEIKSRSITLVSVGTVAIGLFGGEDLLGDGGLPCGWGLVVLVGFVLLVLSAIAASVPRKWCFSRNPAVLAAYPESGKTIDEMRSGLLRDACKHFADNQRQLNQLRIFQVISPVAAGAVALALIVSSTT